ncbi:MAG TPA: PIN domain-containing protein [Vicinamibacteria bacterium]
MKRLLLDLNVVLDALLDRPPHGEAAAKLWAAAEEKRIDALVPAHGVTTLHYLVRQAKGGAAARRAVEAVLSAFGVAPADEPVLRRALSLGWTDFEDAVCAAAAEAAGCDLIVTRDPGGFRGSPVPVVDAATAVSLLGEPKGPEGVSEGASRYERGRRRRRRR